MTETYREEHEMSVYENLKIEDAIEHEHDREAEDLEEDDGNLPEGSYDFI